MADAAWWGAQLPSSRNLGVESMIQSAALGQASKKEKRLEETATTVDALRQKALDYYKSGDRKSMMLTISEMARHSPESAQKFKDVFADLDRTNAFNAAMLVYTAAASDTEQAQNTALGQALETLNVGPTHPFAIDLQDLMKLPFGKEKDEALLDAVQFAQNVDLLPKSRSIEGEKTRIAREQLELNKKKFVSDYLNRIADNKRLEDQLILEQQKEKRVSTNLTDKELTLLDGWNEVSFKAEGQFNEYKELADRWSAPEIQKSVSGFIGGLTTALRNFLGMNNKEIEIIKTGYNKVRHEVVRAMIPESRPTDFDVEMAMKGVPPENSNPEVIASWLRGASKMQGILAAYNRAKADHLESQKRLGKSFVDFNDFWQLNGNRYIDEIIGPPKNEQGLKLGDRYPTIKEPKTKADLFKLTPEQKTNIKIRRNKAYQMAIEAGLATKENVEDIVQFNPNTLEFGVIGPNGKFAQIDTK